MSLTPAAVLSGAITAITCLVTFRIGYRAGRAAQLKECTHMLNEVVGVIAAMRGATVPATVTLPKEN